ncbi:MAG TPA: glycosyltransferase family 4 protein [Methylomirabilota bacterium]|nr:glycosyltransferase family 4 protein [Methylomirabilota bacterium]
MKPLRILWVKVGGLWPPTTGGRLRSLHMVDELSRRHRVGLVTTHPPGDDPTGLVSRLPGCERIDSIPYALPKQDTVRFARDVAGSWASRYPADLWRWRVPAVRARIRQRLAEGVDLFVADFLVAMPNLPAVSGVPVVLFEHNVEHMIWKRLYQVEKRPWRRALLAVEWRKMRRYEAEACARAGLTVAVSEADRAMLSACAPGADIRAVPTGVDTAYFHPNGATETPATLVFTGSMDWYPNEDAVLYFLDAIFPEVRREVPGVSLAVVGRDPSDRVRAAGAAAGIRVTGTVQDVRPYVAEAAVYVVPLRVGGGTRLKIFEALAMGKAVVSTRIGAEGLPIVADRHFLQADTPAAFAQAVIGLLKDADRRRALGLAGRRLVEDRYSWGQVTREFEGHCQELISRHAR